MSRASVISFLNRMVREGFLEYREVTDKGGHKKLYRPSPEARDEGSFRRIIAERIIRRVLEEIATNPKRADEGTGTRPHASGRGGHRGEAEKAGIHRIETSANHRSVVGSHCFPVPALVFTSCSRKIFVAYSHLNTCLNRLFRQL